MKEYFDFYEDSIYDSDGSGLRPEEKELYEEEGAGQGGKEEHDPLRSYMKEMGAVPLLTREGEVEIAKEAADHGYIFRSSNPEKINNPW